MTPQELYRFTDEHRKPFNDVLSTISLEQFEGGVARQIVVQVVSLV